MANTITVKKGDTLSGLYGADWRKLSGYTGDPTKLQIGTVLPAPPATSAPITQPTETPVASVPLATATGGTGSTSLSAPVASTAPTAGTAYTIKSGDTLSALARANNTTVQELMKLNPTITNPNLIYAGRTMNLPGTTANTGAGETADYSGVTDLKSANEAINADQIADASKAPVNTLLEVPTRKTTTEIMKDITTQVAPTTARPATSDFTGDITAYRTQYGVTDLETQLDQLKAEADTLYAEKQSRVTTERGKQVAMNVISGRVGQVEQQENERIAAVERSIANTTNQLNTKYNIINTLMKAKESDYNNAVADYDKQMSNNIAMFNAARGVEEANKSDAEREQDTARSNAQIIMNAYSATGQTYDQLPQAERTTLTKLGVQSGLGADFFANVLKTAAGKDVLTTITSADDTKATIIYKDGTTKVIATGLPAKATSSGGGGLSKTEIKAQAMEADQQTIMADVGKITGDDMKVDPNKMKSLRQDIALNSPELLTWFDNAYRPADMLNADYYPEAVYKNQWLTR